MKEQIRVELMCGETVIFEDGEWDDYEYCWNMLVIKKCNAWVAAFNMRTVRYFIVEEQDEEE